MTSFSAKQADFQIVVDGDNVTSNVSRRLIDLTFTDNRGFEADSIDLRLDDSDNGLALPLRGGSVALQLGWKGQPLWDKGTFIIDEVEHSGAPDTITLRANSAELRGGLTTPLERSFHNETLGAVLQQIASENDLALVVSPSLASVTLAHEDQTNESTANFLTRLATRFDALCSIKMGTLLFANMTSGKTVGGKALPLYTITRNMGDNHRFNIAERNGVTAIRATYYNMREAKKGEVIWGAQEERTSLNKPVKAVETTVETGKLKTINGTYKSRAKALRVAKAEWKKIRRAPGAYIGVKVAYADPVQKAATAAKTPVTGEVSWGKADELKTQKAALRLQEKDLAKIKATTGQTSPSDKTTQIDHSSDNIHTLRHVYASEENATRAARAAYRRMQRGVATFSLTLATGIPELIPDLIVNLRGWKPEIDATDWTIKQVVHRISSSGYTQDIELEMASTEPAD